MRKVTILPNCTDILQRISQNVEPENIELKEAWFAPDLEEDPRETPSHDPSVTPKNNTNTLTWLYSVPHVQEIQASKGTPVSELIEHPDSEGFRNTSNLKKVFLSRIIQLTQWSAISWSRKGIQNSDDDRYSIN